ncbi:MAG: hypothetical protein PVI28_18210 [Gammaproteobacteria bacterium]|jgi:hypothetical protein
MLAARQPMATALVSTRLTIRVTTAQLRPFSDEEAAKNPKFQPFSGMAAPLLGGVSLLARSMLHAYLHHQQTACNEV